MLKISEFSRISQVSVKTLHHYDEVGLFRPVHVDPQSGYRLYRHDQLPQIHKIMAFKEMGLSLEQIAILLRESIDAAEMRSMLKLKRAEIEQQVRAEEKRLSKIEFHLRMLEAEDTVEDLDVVVKPLEPVLGLSMVRYGTDKFKFKDELFQAIESGAVHYAGHLMELYHGADFVRDDANFEYLIPVTSDQPGDVQLQTQGTLKLRTEDGAPEAASLMTYGLDVHDRAVKFGLLYRWAASQDYVIGDKLRLIHHRGPFDTLDTSEWIIEPQLILESGND